MRLLVGFVWIPFVSGLSGERLTLILMPAQNRVYPRVESPPLWIALIKSIRRGSFCDRRYLTKRDNLGKWWAPVYISSIILGNAEPTLNTRKLLFKHEHPPLTQTLQVIGDPGQDKAEPSEDECDSDSDYEDAVEGILVSVRESAELHESEQESKPEPVATLSAGAFTT